MTIINGLTKAGGLTALANETSISITRLVNGKSKTFTIAVREGDAANYPLKVGDVVFVPERIF
jgi:protein involved in polysaccharide export with SLBB domain